MGSAGSAGIGSEADLVYRGELKPGETVRIAHKPETYQGKRVRLPPPHPVRFGVPTATPSGTVAHPGPRCGDRVARTREWSRHGGPPPQPRRELDVDGPVTVSALLARLELNRESVLVIRGDTLVPGDAVLADDDVVEIRPVISGGGA